MPFYRQETENLRTTECYGISAKRAKRVARCRMGIQVRWQSKEHGSTLAVVEGARVSVNGDEVFSRGSVHNGIGD